MQKTQSVFKARVCHRLMGSIVVIVTNCQPHYAVLMTQRPFKRPFYYISTFAGDNSNRPRPSLSLRQLDHNIKVSPICRSILSIHSILPNHHRTIRLLSPSRSPLL